MLLDETVTLDSGFGYRLESVGAIIESPWIRSSDGHPAIAFIGASDFRDSDARQRTRGRTPPPPQWLLDLPYRTIEPDGTISWSIEIDPIFVQQVERGIDRYRQIWGGPTG
jgi:hypothetical protein